jgi:uncharacterized coiled-coil protein SlyX
LFSSLVHFLHKNVTHSLKESKEKLDIIQSVQGQSLTELEKQLVESRNILGSMKDSLVGDILQNLMTVVLAADDNGDMILSDKEIDELVNNFESLQGMDFDNDMIKKVVNGKGRSVAGKSSYTRLSCSCIKKIC